MAPETVSASRRLARAVVVGLVLVAIGFGFGAWWQRDQGEAGVTLSAADVGFAQDMSAHHARAVLLSQTLPRDVDPQVRALADQIVATAGSTWRRPPTTRVCPSRSPAQPWPWSRTRATKSVP